MNKEDIYINLQGKSKEELTEIQNVLIMFNEPTYRKDFKVYYNSNNHNYLEFYDGEWLGSHTITENKQEVTIQQLKEILQPMETFTPIAMKCTQEQFEAIKPKLKKIGEIGVLFQAFYNYNYLTNNYRDEQLLFDFIEGNNDWDEIHKVNVRKEWNEEIFLKACGIKVDTLEQQLEKAKAEVKRIEEEIEESKIKVGDWYLEKGNNRICIATASISEVYLSNKNYCKKITDQELINKLNNLIK